MKGCVGGAFILTVFFAFLFVAFIEANQGALWPGALLLCILVGPLLFLLTCLMGGAAKAFEIRLHSRLPNLGVRSNATWRRWAVNPIGLLWLWGWMAFSMPCEHFPTIFWEGVIPWAFSYFLVEWLNANYTSTVFLPESDPPPTPRSPDPDDEDWTHDLSPPDPAS